VYSTQIKSRRCRKKHCHRKQFSVIAPELAAIKDLKPVRCMRGCRAPHAAAQCILVTFSANTALRLSTPIRCQGHECAEDKQGSLKLRIKTWCESRFVQLTVACVYSRTWATASRQRRSIHVIACSGHSSQMQSPVRVISVDRPMNLRCKSRLTNRERDRQGSDLPALFESDLHWAIVSLERATINKRT
jgi:hypothetical protein